MEGMNEGGTDDDDDDGGRRPGRQIRLGI